MGEQVTGFFPAVLRWARESQGCSIDDVALPQAPREPEQAELPLAEEE